ncbi:MAG: hypothetical protein WD059_12075 [Balneolaceae bacterium]
MKIDPIEIEQLFVQISAEISRAGSERMQLLLMDRFLKRLHGQYLEFDSYIIQLFEVFPSLKHPLLFSGFRPKELEAIIHECEEAANVIPELRQDDSVQRKIDLLKTGFNHVKSWLGISETDREDGLIQLLNIKEQINLNEEAGDVFIPVVETSEGFEKKGRLRKLKVELVGKSGKDEFELRPVFGVIGANTGNLGEKSAKAAGNLLRKNRERSSYWSGTASFELSHTWHAGSSANLALAALFYCEMLKAENQREYFKLNPGIAITGDVDEHGNVLDVDEETIQQKVEAAFFSWAQVLVVPVQQLEQALKIFEELQNEFPNRNLVIKGIGNLRDLFFDRWLTLHKQTSLIEHTARRVWKRRYSSAAILVFLMLIGIIGSMAYGPIDKNPVMADYEGEYLFIQNQFGKTIKQFWVGKKTVDFFHTYGTTNPQVAFFDINADGVNEVFYVTGVNTSEQREVTAWSLSGDSLLWVNNLDFKIHFPRQHGLQNLKFYAREIGITFANDGNPYLIVLASEWNHFPSVTAKLKPETGEVIEKYIHTGQVRDMELVDITGDGVHEIVLAGINNVYWRAFLAVLDLENISGHSPLEGDYIIEDVQRAEELVYLLIPKTIVGRVFDPIQKYSYSTRVKKSEDQQLLTLTISESPARIISGIIKEGVILIDFDYHLNMTGLATSDQWDIYAKEFYESGDISFIPGYEYFEAFKDSVVYWDGSDFEFRNKYGVDPKIRTLG